jgi:putative transcriptional regulator
MDDRANNAVRILRNRLRMTQEEFAHALGLTVGTVNRWENGRFRPSKLAWATIAEFARRRGIAIEPDSEQEGSVPAQRQVA